MSWTRRSASSSPRLTPASSRPRPWRASRPRPPGWACREWLLRPMLKPPRLAMRPLPTKRLPTMRLPTAEATDDRLRSGASGGAPPGHAPDLPPTLPDVRGYAHALARRPPFQPEREAQVGPHHPRALGDHHDHGDQDRRRRRLLAHVPVSYTHPGLPD